MTSETTATSPAPRRRVLMLAYFFPPMAVSGAVRPAAFCRYLPAHGYAPHVLTTPPANVHPPVKLDDSLAALVPPGTRVEALPYVDRRALLLGLRRRLRGASAAGATAAAAAPPAPASASASAGHDGRGLRALRDELVKRLFMFPDQQKDWGGAVLRRVRALAADERPHLVFATGSPWSALLTGLAAARILGVPFVADFRDPWTENLKRDFSPRLARLAAQREREVLAGATRVIANTERLREHFAAYDPAIARKTVTITNGIHDALRALMRGGGAIERPRARRELRYFGTINRQRVPRALLRAVDELAADGRLAPGDLALSFTGGWAALDPATEELLARLEQRGLVERTPAVPYEECIRQMKVSDHLLVLQQGFPMQIPAKIYEYLATGRPLVVIGGEGATADLVVRAGVGRVCADEVEPIKRLLLDLVAADDGDVSADPALLARFDYAELAGSLAHTFDAAIAEFAAGSAR